MPDRYSTSLNCQTGKCCQLFGMEESFFEADLGNPGNGRPFL